MLSIAKLPGERNCERLLFRMMFGPDCCPRCSGTVQQKRSYFWCKMCRVKLRPKAHTWLTASNLTCYQILALMICWFQNVAPGSVYTTLGMSYPTTRRWYSKFRQRLPKDESILEGVVEAD